LGIFDIFSKDNRVRAQSIFDYDACRKHRTTKLLSFRQAARDYYAFEFPDAMVLTNLHCPRFFVYSEKNRLFMEGDFADQIYPALEYVSEDATTEERRAEITRYANNVKNAIYLCCPSKRKQVLSHVGLGGPEAYRQMILHKGFGIFNEWKTSEGIVGAALFLNGKKIAESTIYDKQPGNHFSQALQSYVLDGKPTAKGISVLELVVGWADAGRQTYCYRYDIIFSDRTNYRVAEDSNHDKQLLTELNTFMHSFQDEICCDDEDLQFYADDFREGFVSRENAPVWPPE
jgi:hypothetical protein